MSDQEVVRNYIIGGTLRTKETRAAALEALGHLANDEERALRIGFDFVELRRRAERAEAHARAVSLGPAELSDYLHDLAERAIRLEDEDVLHGAAELVRLADRRSRFDAPDTLAQRSET